jgi:hypothetical protein
MPCFTQSITIQSGSRAEAFCRARSACRWWIKMTVGLYIRGCGSLYRQVGCGRYTVLVGSIRMTIVEMLTRWPLLSDLPAGRMMWETTREPPSSEAMAKSDLTGERGCQPPRLTQITGMGALSSQSKRSARMKGAIELDKLYFRVVMYSCRHYRLLCYLVLCLRCLSEPEDLH